MYYVLSTIYQTTAMQPLALLLVAIGNYILINCAFRTVLKANPQRRDACTIKVIFCG